MIYFVLAFAAIYALLAILVYLGWVTLPADLVLKDFTPKTKLSVVVAFRNEAHNLSTLLKDLLEQTYPESLYEIILVNDHSDDNSLEKLEYFEGNQVKILNLSEGEKGKKTALRLGIQNASGDLIVTTDADCRMEEKWLRTLVNKYENSDAKLIAGPVTFFRKMKVFQFFQTLDFLGFQIITGGSFALGIPVACNGANLAFEKQAYLEHCLNNKTNKLASGDDVFTLFTFQKHFPKQVYFLKNINALVRTAAAENLTSFWEQRKRWASKSAKFGKTWITLVLTYVFLFNLLLLVLFFWGLTDYKVFKVFLWGFGIKFFGDALMLNTSLSFFGRKPLIRFLPLFQLPHMLYTVLVGIASQFSKYQWKGRRY